MATENKTAEKSKKGLIDKDGAISISFSIKHEDLTFGELIGEGGFGKVYKGELDFNPVAIKTFTAQDFTEKTQKAIRSEASVMASVSTQSNYLVKLQGLVLGKPQYALVMEYMPGGDLYHLLHSDQDIAWSVRYQIGRDVSAGLHHLHKHDILHRDLKSLNILLDDRHRAKLADFGLTTLKSTSASATKGVTGTVAWSAPEVLSGEDHSVSSDIYSLGMVLWEMASRQVPYTKAGKLPIMIAWIMAGRKEEVPPHCPAELKVVIQDCWKEKPETRPTASELAKRLDTLWKTQRALEEKKEKTAYVEGSDAPLNSLAALEKYSDFAPKVTSVEQVRMAQGMDSGRPLRISQLDVIPKKPGPSSSAGSAPFIVPPPQPFTPPPVEGSDAPLKSLAALERYSDSASHVASVEGARMAQGRDSGRPLVLSPLSVITKDLGPSSSGGSAPLVVRPPLTRPPASPTSESLEVEKLRREIAALKLKQPPRETQDERLRLEAEKEGPGKEELKKAKVVSDFFAKEKTPLSSPAPQHVPEKKPVLDTKAVEGLLKLVVEGEQDEAEKLITEKPELLLGAGKVTDLSGRTFEKTTAFQYAVWALDWHMWKMLLSHFTDKGEALAQYEQLVSTGLTYTTFISKGLEGLSKTLTSKGPLLEAKGSQQTPHIDALIQALDEYIKNAEKWNYDERAKEHWQKVVGGAQRLLPVHVVNEYCRKDRSFSTAPTFLEDVLPRTRETGKGEWFTGTYDGGLLGEKWSVVLVRPAWGNMCFSAVGDFSFFVESVRVGLTDVGSLLSLTETRAEQRRELAATLKSRLGPSGGVGK